MRKTHIQIVPYLIQVDSHHHPLTCCKLQLSLPGIKPLLAIYSVKPLLNHPAINAADLFHGKTVKLHKWCKMPPCSHSVVAAVDAHTRSINLFILQHMCRKKSRYLSRTEPLSCKDTIQLLIH